MQQQRLNFTIGNVNNNVVNDYFTDNDFPANADSIDGRKILKIISNSNSNSNNSSSSSTINSSSKVQLCKCKKPVQIKQVSKQNQNQGRYFNTCSLKACDYFAWADYAEHDVKVSSNIEWRRFTREQGWTIVSSGGFSPNHVIQGGVGDCWFLSAVAVLAEREDIIKSIVVDKELRPDGIQTFRLFIDGEFKVIQVDNFLPCKASTDIHFSKKAKGSHNNDDLKFSHSKNSQLWVPFLEKAYSKAHGSYHAISGGWISEAMLDLTGAPTEKISFSNPQFDSENMWIRLLSFKSSSFPMGASTANTGEGIVGNHAYSIIDVREIENSIIGQQTNITNFMSSSSSSSSSLDSLLPVSSYDYGHQSEFISENGTLRLIRIRNPWGYKEFTGGLSSNSSQWTQKLRHLLDHDKQEGLFWISFHDFLCRYESMEVCKVHTSDWFSKSYPCYIRDTITASKKTRTSTTTSSQAPSTLPSAASVSYLVYDMTVLESTWLYLWLIQKTKRGKFSSLSERLYYYKSLGLIVVDRESANVISAKYSGCCRDTAAMELQINAGNYFVIIINFDTANNSNMDEYDFVLRVYASQPLIVENISNTEIDLLSLVKAAFSSSIRLSNSTFCNWLRKESLFSTIIPNSSNKNVIDLTDDSEVFVEDRTNDSTIKFNLLQGHNGFAFLIVENNDSRSLNLRLVIRTTNYRILHDSTTKVTAAIVKDNMSSNSISKPYRTKNYTETHLSPFIPPNTLNVICYFIRWPLDEDGEGIGNYYATTTKKSNLVIINDVSITDLDDGSSKVENMTIPYCPILLK